MNRNPERHIMKTEIRELATEIATALNPSLFRDLTPDHDSGITEDATARQTDQQSHMISTIEAVLSKRAGGKAKEEPKVEKVEEKPVEKVVENTEPKATETEKPKVEQPKTEKKAGAR